jgi:acyl carrier protein
MTTLFAKLGIKYVDHCAVTCHDLNSTLADYLALPGSRLLRGPGDNPAQDVQYAFVDLQGSGIIEILAPLSKKSPINGHLASGGGAYHLCYAVEDLDKAITIAQNDFQAKLIIEPKTDLAFDRRRVAFLMHKNHGLFELLEATPKDVKPQQTSEGVASSLYVSKNESAIKFDNKLLAIFNQVFLLNESDISMVTIDTISQWDSFKHLLLTMEIEKEFEVNISASDLASISKLSQFKPFLT